MRRSALALGASVLALALTAGPAAADPVPGQSATDTTGAVQVGAVAVNAPVRVASDGDGSTTGVTAGGPQTTGDSTGSAQVTSVHADAPVRVLSDGDDATTGQGGAGGTQDASDSLGSAQAGAVDANAPVRVGSDGDNSAGGGNGGGSQATADSGGTGQVGGAAGAQATGDSDGSAQVGSPGVTAPLRVLSDGDDATTGGSSGSQTVNGSTGAAQIGSPQVYLPIRVAGAGLPGGGGADVLASPSEAAPVGGGDGGSGSPSAEELRRLMDGADPDPALMLGSSDDAAGENAGQFATLGVSASSLPLTGSDPLALLALGLWLLAAGACAMRLVPGGRRG
jgi:hypothetical protein